MASHQTALVTGATGFVGSHLCRALLASGWRVRALHRPTSNLAAVEDLRVELITGDILDPDSLARAMRGVDTVFHAAAQSAYWRRPREVFQAAVAGTRYVVEAASAAASVRRFVLTSSVAALGVPRRGELLNESHTFKLRPQAFPYGHAKYQSELTARRLAEGRLHLVIVNPAVVLGPGDRNLISGSILLETARGRSFAYNDGGINVVHIDDVVAGHLAAAEFGVNGERYILGGENLTHRQVLTEAARLVGRRPPWLRLPNWLIPMFASLLDLAGRFVATPLNGPQLRMSRHRMWVDISKAQRELGLPPPKPFSLAAKDAYDWYRSAGVI